MPSSIIAIVFLTMVCILSGCGFYGDARENDSVIITKKSADVFSGAFDTKALNNTEKLQFVNIDKTLTERWPRIQPLSRVLEKAFDISEKIRHKSDIDLKRYYLKAKNVIASKATFSQITEKFDILKAEYNLAAQERNKNLDTRMGSVLYVKDSKNEAGKIMMRPKNIPASIPAPPTLESRDLRYRIYPKNVAPIPLAFGGNDNRR